VTDQVHRLGEVLRAAREAKGVELPRVERETKIRERYLSALERGEYRELPGAVYTKGFLRNYGSYLGLDPEYLIDLYRLETLDARAERLQAPARPRPMGARRTRTFVVTPGAVVAAILTLMVGGFFAFFGYQLVNFAREPGLRITDPPGNVSGYTEERITIRGTTEPNATVTVSNLRENPTVQADAAGDFEVTVELVPGSNVVRLSAYDPQTDRTTPTQDRTIIVVRETATSPSATPAALALLSPEDGATVTSPIELTGTAAPDAAVVVTATLEEAPAPNFEVMDASGAIIEVEPAAPGTPEPVEVTADASGAFTTPLALPPGTWRIDVVVGTQAAARTVVVPVAVDVLAATLRIGEGGSYLEIEEDGAPVAATSGGIAAEGDTVEATAADEIRILAGNAGAVRLSVNGIDIGTMGPSGAVIDWRIRTTDG
jgi:cytoskeletal protein RodZ